MDDKALRDDILAEPDFEPGVGDAGAVDNRLVISAPMDREFIP
ncbi:MAG: hypothetical protein ACXU82_05120 [Caulobacteraceae bacterium]